MDHRINVPLVAKLVCCFTLFSCPQSVYAIDKLMVLGLFKDKAIVEIDGKRRVLSRGKATPDGVRLITANSDQAVIEVNGEQGAYKVGTHISSSYAAASPQATVRIWPDAMGMYQVNGSINEFLVKFLVDTGATLVAMNKNQAKRLGLDYKLDGIASRMTTASGIAKAYYLTLKKVKVGDILLRDIQAAVIDGEFPTTILLGNSFLNRVEMVRDGTVMELRKK